MYTMSRKPDDFKLDTIKLERNGELEFGLQHQRETKKEESHYQCLLTTNREEPELFMNVSRKQETEPDEPEVYVNIAHAKKIAQPSPPGLSQPSTPGLSQEKNTTDTQKSSGPYLKSDASTQPAMSAVSARQSRNPPDTAPSDGNMQSLASPNKKDGRGSRNKCIIVICCVLVAFTLLLTFIGLNRSDLEKNQAEGSQSTVTSNMLIMNLTKQVRELEESLKQVKMESNTAIRNLNASLSQMKMERDAAIGHLNAQSNMLTVNLTNQVRELEVSLRDLDRRLSASIDSHSSRLDTADTNLQLMINSHISEYSSLVSTSENNYSRLATRISGNYMSLTNRITDLQNSVDTTNSRLRSSKWNKLGVSM